MSQTLVSASGSLVHVGPEASVGPQQPQPQPQERPHHDEEAAAMATDPLHSLLAEVKGQVQFLLYLTDQIEESLGQLHGEGDESQAAFLCKVLSMYSSQLEVKHRNIGEGLASTRRAVQEVIRDHESR